MKGRCLVLLATSLAVAPRVARAVNVKLPVEGATMNLSVLVQTHALFNEHGTPDGTGWSSDVFMRRTRVSASGDATKYFWYFFQVDNPNFGKYGNFTSRMVVQDAIFAWAPTGSTGNDVLLIEGGLIRVPTARGTITNINNNFTIDGHPDLIRGFNPSFFNANRSLGIEARGWAMDKKIGFRAGVFEGIRPSAADTDLNSKTQPLFAGIVNFNILGTTEGGFSYDSIYFAKDPILSVGVSGGYQSRAVRVAKGVADFQTLGTTAFLEYPLNEDNEAIALFTGYRHAMGSGSRDTGWAWAGDLGYRWKWLKPYLSYEWYTSDDCPTDPTQLSGAALLTCQTSLTAGAHTADSRNLRAGLDIFFNKALNHLMIEFSVNHGLSSWGPQSITTATAGYTPLSLDPAAGSTTRQPINTLLSSPVQRSVLMQWGVVF